MLLKHLFIWVRVGVSSFKTLTAPCLHVLIRYNMQHLSSLANKYFCFNFSLPCYQFPQKKQVSWRFFAWYWEPDHTMQLDKNRKDQTNCKFLFMFYNTIICSMTALYHNILLLFNSMGIALNMWLPLCIICRPLIYWSRNLHGIKRSKVDFVLSRYTILRFRFEILFS